MKTKLFIKRKAVRGVEDFTFTVEIEKQFYPLYLSPNDSPLLAYLLQNEETYTKDGEIELDLSIERKSFNDKDNDNAKIEYIAYSFTLDDAEFNLKPRTEDKRLLGYLLKDI